MKHIKDLVFASVLAALTCVATMVITIPVPTGGYLNLGDTVVLLSAYLLGPWWGAAAAGIGSGLADLMAGYTLYAPATLVIKASMAALAALLYRGLGRKSGALVPCGLVAEAVMVLGYWGFEGILAGSLMAAVGGLGANLLQGVFGLAASTALAAALKKSPWVKEAFPCF